MKTDLLQLGYSGAELHRFQEFQPSMMKMISALNDTCTVVYAAICDKTKAYWGWTPERLENFTFAQTLMMDILPRIEVAHMPIIIYDKGRLTAAKAREFKRAFDRSRLSPSFIP